MRQIWVRFRSIDPDESATWAAFQADEERAKSKQKLADIDDVMRMVGGGPRA